VLPDGPDVLSTAFFGSQPLTTTVPSQADTFRFVTQGATARFADLEFSSTSERKREVVTIERAVRCPPLSTSLILFVG
jgi:hypothetical protein